MPTITISDGEKTALQDYVENITAYIAPGYEINFPDHRLPSTASISRVERNAQGQPIRYVRFGQETPADGPLLIIPLTHLHPEDELSRSHACTVGETQNDLYFHRNVYDFPSERPANMSSKRYAQYQQKIAEFDDLEKRVRAIENQLSAEQIKEMQQYANMRQKLDQHYKRYPQRDLAIYKKTVRDLGDYLTALNERDEARSKLPLEQLEGERYSELERKCHETYFFNADESTLVPDYYPSLMTELEHVQSQIAQYPDFGHHSLLLKERKRIGENKSLTELKNDADYKAIENELLAHYQKYTDHYEMYFGPIDPIIDPLAQIEKQQIAVQKILSELSEYNKLLDEQDRLKSDDQSAERLEEIEATLAEYDNKYFHKLNENPDYQKRLAIKQNQISTHQHNLTYFLRLLEKQNELLLAKSPERIKAEDSGLEETLNLLSRQYAGLLDDGHLTYLDLMSDEMQAEIQEEIQNWQALKEEESLLEDSINNYLRIKEEALIYLDIENQVKEYESHKSATQLTNEIAHCEDFKIFYGNTNVSGAGVEKKRPTEYATNYHYIFEKTFKRGVNTILNHNVKLAVDKSGELFVINRKESNQQEHLGTLPKIRRAKEFGFFRQSRKGVMKKIEFQHYAGDDLETFFATYKTSDATKNKIAHALLHLYMSQVSSKNIVHTDFSMLNVCIKISEDRKIKLSLIDWHEAFYDTPENRLTTDHERKGSKGFLAPEFFNNAADHTKQLDTPMTELIKMLKPIENRHFSPATDIYAIGCMLIDHIKLSNDSPYYAFAKKMVSLKPEDRPTSEQIQEFLNDPHADTLTSSGPVVSGL